MPKKLKVSPNERVDIPDFIRASNDYTSETIETHVQKVLLGDRGYILEGFRVQIINDAGNPARVVVYNGNAFNPDGTRLHNEADPAYAQEISLTGASTTFYLEVIFEENDSDEDARAFWDPTVDNTSPIPDGREFDATVVTRTTPTWRIVRPVSTSGFQYSITTPDSVRIPLVKLTTEGDNTIIGASNPGLATDYPATVTEDDFIDTVNPTRLKVADARLFSDSTDNAVTIDPSALTPSGTQAALVSFADKENNILVMTGSITGDYPAGTVIQATGRTQEYMVERVNGLPPSVDTGLTDSPDNAARFWQGNEIRGSGLSVSKEDGAVRDDLNVKTLKDQVDFMAAQIREMKWGAQRVGDDGIENSRIPQTVFDVGNTDLRYFDKSRGIEGSATFVITVGDGVNSFGDFNAADETAIQAAVDAASSGDTVFIKPGSYTFVATVTVTKSLNFVGDGLITNLITFTDNTPLFTFPTPAFGAFARFENLGMIAVNNQERTIETGLTGLSTFRMDNCLSVGHIFLGDETANYLTVGVENSIITAQSLGSYTLIGGAAGDAPPADQVLVENCVFTTLDDTIVLHFSNIGQLHMENNFWQTRDSVQDSNSTFVRIYEFNSIGQGSITNTYIDCSNADFLPQMVGGISGQSNHVQGLNIDGITVVGSGSKPQSDQFPFIDIEQYYLLDVRNVLFNTPVEAASSACVLFKLGLENDFSVDASAANILSIDNCHLGFEPTDSGNGIQVGDLTGSGPAQDMNITIRNVSLYQCRTGITLGYHGNAHIVNCLVDGGAGSASAQYGISALPTGGATDVLNVVIDSCTIQEIQSLNAPEVAGIRFHGDPQHLATVVPTVTNCLINEIGSDTAVTTVLATGVSVDPGVFFTRLSVTNNIIQDVGCPSAGSTFGVGVFGTQSSGNALGFGLHIHGNDIFEIGANANFVNCIGVFLQGLGNGALINATVSNNNIGGSSLSIGNFGVAFRQAGPVGTIFQGKITGNTIAVSNASPSLFGAAIDVISNDITGMVISDNTCIPPGTGTGGMINVALSDTGSEGICDGLVITDNYLIGATGTTYGIFLAGVGGVAAGLYTGANISGNSVNLKATSAPTAVPVTCITMFTAHFEEMRVCNNHTRIGEDGFNADARHIFISGLDQTLSSGLVVANNIGFNQPGDSNLSMVTLQNCNNLTVTGNNWTFTDDGLGDAGNVSIDLDNLADVTFNGNFVRSGLGIAVALANNVVRLIAVGNAFGAGTVQITGVSIPNENAFTNGTASTIATNLNLSA